MATLHNLGFPRIGAKRELKFAQESYWKGNTTDSDLLQCAQDLRLFNWQQQSACDYVPVGDFSLYDHVLDTSFLFGNLPERAQALEGSSLDNYFRVARGRSSDQHSEQACHCIAAGEMTKWFDTNYHYIVPEVSANTEFSLNPEILLAQLVEAKSQQLTANIKPVIIGPLTYLWLAKAKEGFQPLALLDKLLPLYTELFSILKEQGLEWLQIDEPILVTELDAQWQHAFNKTYQQLNNSGIKLLLSTYFGQLKENLTLACKLPVAGLHIDAINGKSEVTQIIDTLPDDKILSLGVINGRNIWKTDLTATLNWLEPIAEKLQERLWLAPSCSLLHVPVDLDSEVKLDSEIKNWLAFAKQKLEELSILGSAINHGRAAVQDQLKNNAEAIINRQQSQRVHKQAVKNAVKNIQPSFAKRQSSYLDRAVLQREIFNLPLLPTTTIGSFPQTADIRKTRSQFKSGKLSADSYQQNMQQHIKDSVEQQEALGLDVLVHGEAERNDMVEYFGEQLEGYVFSQLGWVQSYGSRCVKPPILFGDIQRPQAMTVAWSQYAQSLTDKPMKGMLTGPVTILNWSFIRDDQPRSETCKQLALAIREEVLDLEQAGLNIIQIDEAALREGLPLRRAEWQAYLDWAVEAFCICANGVKDSTQIHTHMCYSEFNDIIAAISAMDADVITIETSRSDMELLDVFEDFNYPNELGPGVYDIHSPNIPSVQQVKDLIDQAAKRIPVERLWINPDCGLKTRQWQEVIPALENMVAAALSLREEYMN